MEINTQFDRALECRLTRNSTELIRDVVGCTPETVRDAALFAVETLDLAKLGAQAVFGDKAKPEHAIALYDRMLNLLPGTAARSEARLQEEAHEYWQAQQGKKDLHSEGAAPVAPPLQMLFEPPADWGKSSNASI
ncbi:MAG: hypothetical protein KGS72_22125 [Cyanobacteria bacterium REEB67]|nr:hypothetical protein [Cyanobacteria bacterium REEB67]